MAYWRGSETPIAKETDWVSQVGMRERHDTLAGIVFADKAGKVVVEQSGDGKNWDFLEEVAVEASKGKSFSVALVATYWRLRYKNTAASDQTAFRISVSTQAGGDS